MEGWIHSVLLCWSNKCSFCIVAQAVENCKGKIEYLFGRGLQGISCLRRMGIGVSCRISLFYHME